MTPPPISIIVPALDEADGIAATLSRLRAPEVLEVIVVDGGSRDGTTDVARPLADRLIEAPRGRARQMNAGAGVARGDVLLFLHADTGVPTGFGHAIVRALEDEAVIGGRFDVELDDPAWGYRFLAWTINLRSRTSRIFTGDQAIFIRREAFRRLGGFPDVPLLEDVILAKAMKDAGRIASLRERVRTSARRWQKRGLLRTMLLMYRIRFLHWVGVPPERLARLYSDVR